jgi:hypothetical protein
MTLILELTRASMTLIEPIPRYDGGGAGHVGSIEVGRALAMPMRSSSHMDSPNAACCAFAAHLLPHPCLGDGVSESWAQPVAHPRSASLTLQ